MSNEGFIEKMVLKKVEALWKEGQSPTQIEEAITKTTVEVLDASAEVFLDLLKKNSVTSLRESRILAAGFELRLEQRWFRGFDLLETLVGCCLELVQEAYKEYNAGTKANVHLFEALFRLHARAICISREALVLMKSGYADGAIARWRSLFEVVATGLHLAKHGDQTAEKYLCYQVVEEAREMQTYRENFGRLGFDPLPDEEWNKVQTILEALEHRFGKSFSRPYGWTIGTVSKDRLNFSGILEALGHDSWKPFYEVACGQVHSGARALYSRISHPDPASILLVGPTNVGLAEPAQYLAISLLQLTNAIVFRFSTEMRTVVISALDKLVTEIQDVFTEIQNDINNEEREKPTSNI